MNSRLHIDSSAIFRHEPELVIFKGERVKYLMIVSLLLFGSLSQAKAKSEACEAKLLSFERDYEDAYKAWINRNDLTSEDVLNAEFIKGFGLYRTPILLVRTGKRLFVFNSFGRQIQVYPKTTETIRNSYILVGEGELSTQRAGQRYEFFEKGRTTIIDLQKERSHQLQVHVIER
jgi:hypothetical protein